MTRRGCMIIGGSRRMGRCQSVAAFTNGFAEVCDRCARNPVTWEVKPQYRPIPTEGEQP